MLNILSIINYITPHIQEVTPMENTINFLILTIILLFLLLTAAIITIIKILKTQDAYTFYYKRGSRLYNLAFKDDLTNLFNRNAYIRDLAKLERKKLKGLWFSIYDIDDFKKINDTKGHLFGDEILILAANRLRKIFNDKNHTVYRIGGDEFLVISTDISEDDLVNLLLELKKAELKNADFRFSKGYSVVSKNGSESFNIAFENADQMLYADKKSKKQKEHC